MVLITIIYTAYQSESRDDEAGANPSQLQEEVLYTWAGSDYRLWMLNHWIYSSTTVHLVAIWATISGSYFQLNVLVCIGRDFNARYGLTVVFKNKLKLTVKFWA